jgi:hypothetical protein
MPATKMQKMQRGKISHGWLTVINLIINRLGEANKNNAEIKKKLIKKGDGR